MNKALILLFVLCHTATLVLAQEETESPAEPRRDNREVDSLKTDIGEQGMVVVDSVRVEKRPINPLAPSKAAFYSAVVPGLGQVYNRRYWKVPIVYAALGASIYGYTYNDGLYNRFRNAFKRRQAGFNDDEFFDLRPDDGITPETPDLDLEDLQNQQERYQRDRDLLLLVTIAVYALNIVDANVDAHLKQFNLDEDLSIDMEVKPYLGVDPVTTHANYGIAMVFTLD